MPGTCTTRYPVSVRGSALSFVASAGENYFCVRYCISIGRQLKGTRTSLKILQKSADVGTPVPAGTRYLCAATRICASAGGKTMKR